MTAVLHGHLLGPTTSQLCQLTIHANVYTWWLLLVNKQMVVLWQQHPGFCTRQQAHITKHAASALCLCVRL